MLMSQKKHPQKRETTPWERHRTIQDMVEAAPRLRVGSSTSYTYLHDPKHLVFALARYKFCAKMLQGKNQVMEIGGGDGFCAPIVAEAVGHLTLVDWDADQVADNRDRHAGSKNVSFLHHDMNGSAPSLKVDAAYAIDVIEHLAPETEAAFMGNIVKCLNPHGVLIIGTPNINAEKYAGEASEIGHINLKSHDSLGELMQTYFHNVFQFGMNDEVVHTGFSEMSHFLWAVGVGQRSG